MFRLQAFLPGTCDALNREKQGCSGWETGTKSFLSQLIGQNYPEMEHIAITGFFEIGASDCQYVTVQGVVAIFCD